MQAMTTEAPFSAQEVIAVTGELVALSQKELAAYVAQIGHQLVKPESNAFSLLVVACQPSGADIAKAKSIDATILTERQFLDRLPVPDLIERAQAEASDPATSKRRLTELAAVVPEAVAQNPLWQILHLQDPNFFDDEIGLLKLRLLQILPDGLFDKLAASISASKISVDVFESSGVDYEDSDAESLSHAISVSDFSISVFCDGGDTVLEDVGPGCEDRLPIAEALRAYLRQPFADLQGFANRYGLDYEEEMSPCDGSPLFLGGLSIEYKDELISYEWGSLPDDKSLISRLKEAGDDVYSGVSLLEVGHRRPLFSCPPVVADDFGTEGWIDFKWVCDCYVPIAEATDADLNLDQEIY